MIDLRTLGNVELRGSQGEELCAILQQPKRLALLLYLALVRPHGFRRRDSVMALFWPQVDQQRGRAALRQALHVLRATLGSDILVRRGEDEIGMNPSALWCDVVAFDQALDEGEPEAALALYRGDLLEGFFIGKASPELERWLDDERNRVRSSAAEAACKAAVRAARRGDLAQALVWARRATKLEPASEDELRRMVILLDEAGDRSAALALYAAFVRRLALDLQTEPAWETKQLMERIRARVTSVASAR
jgi:DNA-binding SARP family transcriptional activator